MAKTTAHQWISWSSPFKLKASLFFGKKKKQRIHCRRGKNQCGGKSPPDCEVKIISVCLKWAGGGASSDSDWWSGCTDKKENKFSSYIRKFRMEQLQSHIWLTAYSYMGKYFCILGSPSSYMTLQLLHSEFPYIWGKFYFIFYQCGGGGIQLCCALPKFKHLLCKTSEPLFCFSFTG